MAGVKVERIQFRCTEATKDVLQMFAAEEKLPLSAFLDRCIEQYIDQKQSMDLPKEVLGPLRMAALAAGETDAQFLTRLVYAYVYRTELVEARVGSWGLRHRGDAVPKLVPIAARVPPWVKQHIAIRAINANQDESAFIRDFLASHLIKFRGPDEA